MSEDAAPQDTTQLSILTELNSLGDAHLVGSALDDAGIAYKVVEHQSHGFDVAMPHGFAMLYVDVNRMEEATTVVAQVREDERLMDEQSEEDDEDEDGEA